jgi:hypothetical protein
MWDQGVANVKRVWKLEIANEEFASEGLLHSLCYETASWGTCFLLSLFWLNYKIQCCFVCVHNFYSHCTLLLTFCIPISFDITDGNLVGCFSVSPASWSSTFSFLFHMLAIWKKPLLISY